MGTTNENSNVTTNVEKTNVKKTLVSKETGEKITADLLADMKNKAKALKSNSGSKSVFNYAKIADNLRDLRDVLPKLHYVTDEIISDVKKNKSDFVNEKTKIDYAKNQIYSKIKKDIRKSVQDFKSVKNQWTLNEQAVIRSLCQ